MGFSNERMRTGQLVNWFLLDGLELTPAGYPVTQALSLPFGVDHLIGFNELLTCKHPENAGVHFFLDDYQFERFWRMPERYLYALEKCPLVIGPDFSLYTDFPAPIQHWNHYRNQLLTAWLQHNGVCAIPTASWSDEDSFRWCFDGISKGGAVAVSTVGCLVHQDALQGLLSGVAELIRRPASGPERRRSNGRQRQQHERFPGHGRRRRSARSSRTGNARGSGSTGSSSSVPAGRPAHRCKRLRPPDPAAGLRDGERCTAADDA